MTEYEGHKHHYNMLKNKSIIYIRNTIFTLMTNTEKIKDTNSHYNKDANDCFYPSFALVNKYLTAIVKKCTKDLERYKSQP